MAPLSDGTFDLMCALLQPCPRLLYVGPGVARSDHDFLLEVRVMQTLRRPLIKVF